MSNIDPIFGGIVSSVRVERKTLSWIHGIKTIPSSELFAWVEAVNATDGTRPFERESIMCHSFIPLTHSLGISLPSNTNPPFLRFLLFPPLLFASRMHDGQIQRGGHRPLQPAGQHDSRRARNMAG
jgi:hypothetical protein